MGGTEKGVTERQRVLGDRIRARRMKLALSQEALALRAGINRSYVGALETGRRNMSIDNLCRLAKALDVDAGRLVAGLQDLQGRDGT